MSKCTDWIPMTLMKACFHKRLRYSGRLSSECRDRTTRSVVRMHLRPDLIFLLYENPTETQPLLSILRKEVIQPHLPIQLPCYDFTPVISPAFDGSIQ